jgi:hypothetical protein
MPIDDKLLDAKRRLSLQHLGKGGVCGVGIGNGGKGELVLQVHLDPGDPNAGDNVPEEFDGYVVQKQRTGPFRKLGARGES